MQLVLVKLWSLSWLPGKAVLPVHSITASYAGTKREGIIFSNFKEGWVSKERSKESCDL